MDKIDNIITKLCLLRDPVFSVYACRSEQDAERVVVEASDGTERVVLRGSVSPKGILTWERELEREEERALSARIALAVGESARKPFLRRRAGHYKFLIPVALGTCSIVAFAFVTHLDGPRVAVWEGESTARPEIRMSGGRLTVVFEPDMAPPREVTASAGGGRGPMKEILWVGAPGENEGNRERSFAVDGGMESLENAAVGWTDGEGREGRAILTARERPIVSLLYWLLTFCMFGVAFYGGVGLAVLASRR